MSLERATSIVLAACGSLLEKLLHFSEGFRADVVFDSFGVRGGCLLRNTQSKQESIHNLMPTTGGFRQTGAFDCQFDGCVGLSHYQTVTLQTCHRSVCRHVADSEVRCQIDQPARAFPIHQVRDRFDVVLRKFRGVIVTRAFVQLPASFSTVHRLHLLQIVAVYLPCRYG